MKIALIYPRIDYNVDFFANDGYSRNMQGYPPLSLAYVAAIIKKAGHEAIIIDGNILNLRLGGIINELKNFSPDLLGFTVTIPTFHGTIQWINSIKEIMNIPVLIGGASTGLYALEFMGHRQIDYLIRDDCLNSLPEFLNNFHDKKYLRNISGLCFREEGDIVINKVTAPGDNISCMPFPARELLPNNKYFSPFSERKNFTPFITSKGCISRCIYCCLNGNLQLRNIDDVSGELEECYHRFKIRDIDFYDSIFTVNKKRALEICRIMRAKKLDFRWSARTHVNFIDEELLKEMASSGCRMIMYGIESTNIEIIRNLNRIAASLDRIKGVINSTKKAGITAFGFFMLGAPGETETTIKDTLKASRELGFDFVQFTKMIPVPGTQLYNRYLEDYKYDYWRQVVIDNKPKCGLSAVGTQLETPVIIEYARRGNIGFYLSLKQMLKIISGIKNYRQLINYFRSGKNMLTSRIFGLCRYYFNRARYKYAKDNSLRPLR